jgi:hypothetical protein
MDGGDRLGSVWDASWALRVGRTVIVPLRLLTCAPSYSGSSYRSPTSCTGVATFSSEPSVEPERSRARSCLGPYELAG